MKVTPSALYCYTVGGILMARLDELMVDEAEGAAGWPLFAPRSRNSHGGPTMPPSCPLLGLDRRWPSPQK